MNENYEEPLDAAQSCLSAIKYSCLLNMVIILVLGFLIAFALSAIPSITLAMAGMR